MCHELFSSSTFSSDKRAEARVTRPHLHRFGLGKRAGVIWARLFWAAPAVQRLRDRRSHSLFRPRFNHGISCGSSAIIPFLISTSATGIRERERKKKRKEKSTENRALSRTSRIKSRRPFMIVFWEFLVSMGVCHVGVRFCSLGLRVLGDGARSLVGNKQGWPLFSYFCSEDFFFFFWNWIVVSEGFFRAPWSWVAWKRVPLVSSYSASVFWFFLVFSSWMIL